VFRRSARLTSWINAGLSQPRAKPRRILANLQATLTRMGPVGCSMIPLLWLAHPRQLLLEPQS